MRHLRIRTN